MSPEEIYGALIQQGYAPFQAQAILANIRAESGFNPRAYNAGEGAHGFIQWRGPRLAALNEFARSRGTDINDPMTQIAFIKHEMGGAEVTAGNAFRASTDVASANAALERYIRYYNKGGVEQAKRLGYATGQDPRTLAVARAPGGPTPLAFTMTKDAPAAPAAPPSLFDRLTSPEGLALGLGGVGALAAAAFGGGGAPDPAMAPERARVADLRQPVPELPMPSPMAMGTLQTLQPQGFDALPVSQSPSLIGNPNRRR